MGSKSAAKVDKKSSKKVEKVEKVEKAAAPVKVRTVVCGSARSPSQGGV